jgi:hypothetical protein
MNVLIAENQAFGVRESVTRSPFCCANCLKEPALSPCQLSGVSRHLLNDGACASSLAYVIAEQQTDLK